MTSPSNSNDNLLSLITVTEILDNIPAEIFIKDKDSNYIFINRYCEDMWGIPRNALYGTNGSDFFDPEKVQRFIENDKKVFQLGSQLDYEDMYWDVNRKEYRNSKIIKTAIFDQDNKPLFSIGVEIDITSRIRAEAALRERDEKLRAFYQLASFGIALRNIKGEFIEFNESFRQITGYSSQELLSLNISDLTPHKYRQSDEIRTRDLLEKRHPGPYIKEYIRKDGKLVSVRINGVLITGTDDQKYVWTIVEDVSERNRTEIDLQIAAIALEAQIGIFVTDSSGVILKVNQAFTKDTGFTPEDAVGKTPRILRSGVQSEEFYVELRKKVRLSGVWEGTIWNRNKKGEIYPVLMTIKNVQNSDGITTHYVATQVNIHERKQAERQLAEQTKKLRELSDHLLSVREEERNRLALELHDELGQLLTAMKIDIKRMRNRQMDATEMEITLSEMATLVDDTITSVKRIAANLRPAMLNELGLRPALEWLCEDFSKRYDYIQCKFVCTIANFNIDGERATAIYRVVQECLTNVVKHSNATKVHVAVGIIGQNKLFISVQDNGIGMQEASEHNGFGMLGMRERVRVLGGQFEVSSIPDEGVTIDVIMPMHSQITGEEK